MVHLSALSSLEWEAGGNHSSMTQSTSHLKGLCRSMWQSGMMIRVVLPEECNGVVETAFSWSQTTIGCQRSSPWKHRLLIPYRHIWARGLGAFSTRSLVLESSLYRGLNIESYKGAPLLGHLYRDFVHWVIQIGLGSNSPRWTLPPVIQFSVSSCSLTLGDDEIHVMKKHWCFLSPLIDSLILFFPSAFSKWAVSLVQLFLIFHQLPQL